MLAGFPAGWCSRSVLSCKHARHRDCPRSGKDSRCRNSWRPSCSLPLPSPPLPVCQRTGEPAMPLNACELEIDLFCHGMVVPSDVSLEGARSVSRTRAGLGSGLEIAIPTASMVKDEIWVNVPIVEPFAKQSPFRLLGGQVAGYRIVDSRTCEEYPVRLPAAPDWYARETPRGVPMARVGVLQGSYLAIYAN